MQAQVVGQEEKGMTEDEMAGWHHWLDGRESEWTLGVGDVPGASVRNSAHGKGHEEGGTQRRDQASGNPLFPSI